MRSGLGVFVVFFSIHTVSYTYYDTYNYYYYYPFLIVINVIMGSRQKCVRFFVCYFLLSFWLFRSEKTKILLTCCRWGYWQMSTPPVCNVSSELVKPNVLPSKKEKWRRWFHTHTHTAKWIKWSITFFYPPHFVFFLWNRSEFLNRNRRMTKRKKKKKKSSGVISIFYVSLCALMPDWRNRKNSLLSPKNHLFLTVCNSFSIHISIIFQFITQQ